MKHPIFTIKNLKCAYPGAQKPVLEIDDFQVFKKELVFFLGVSGVGKSTLIESLGLMNRTIVPDADAKLTYHKGDSALSLFELWDGDESKLAEFRSKEYSFIFQSSNLFEKISLQANAIMPALANASNTEDLELRAHKLAKAILSNVSIEDYNTKNAGAISGGQKQRLAFIQAMVSDHEVLFGDEPTGNLDWGNAKKVMQTLKDHISNNNKTGLVVSHDVNLSVEFADRIVLMTGKSNPEMPSRKTGQILAHNIFEKQAGDWKSANQHLSNDEMIAMLKGHFVEQAQ